MPEQPPADGVSQLAAARAQLLGAGPSEIDADPSPRGPLF